MQALQRLADAVEEGRLDRGHAERLAGFIVMAQHGHHPAYHSWWRRVRQLRELGVDVELLGLGRAPREVLARRA